MQKERRKNERGAQVPCRSRRKFLQACSGAAAAVLAQPVFASLPVGDERILRFNHLHTGEKLQCCYWYRGEYLEEPMAEINMLLRDFRTGDIETIDPALMDTLWRLQQAVGGNQSYEIISGYRSPATNAMLRGGSASSGVAKKSLHMQGRAIDVRLPGKDLSVLQQAALKMHNGGVGYYSKSNFLHLDTGRKRHWGS